MTDILGNHKKLYQSHYIQGKEQELVNFEFIKKVFNEPNLKNLIIDILIMILAVKNIYTN